jgi:hypothetical protein
MFHPRLCGSHGASSIVIMDFISSLPITYLGIKGFVLLLLVIE